MPETSEILSAFYRDVWEKSDLSRLAAYFSETAHTPVKVAERRIELDEIREWMQIFHSAVTDISVSPVKVIDSGDWASGLSRVTCTSHSGEKDVSVFQTVMARQENGKLVESYPQFDFLRFFEQLGRMPEDSYALLMGNVCLN